ncbi:hypothetical protein KIPB_006444 [Kipferlia bialata]|uniref:Uncharacterized protein n=1 Tax=Kipferlia bialata TaxID=797122 RepID=A0A9K3GJ95_9EUKA|nr:hypothetical protein KIPB_006444 [Kipferlia bialata]|eukprot:g6444.t1
MESLLFVKRASLVKILGQQVDETASAALEPLYASQWMATLQAVPAYQELVSTLEAGSEGGETSPLALVDLSDKDSLSGYLGLWAGACACLLGCVLANYAGIEDTQLKAIKAGPEEAQARIEAALGITVDPRLSCLGAMDVAVGVLHALSSSRVRVPHISLDCRLWVARASLVCQACALGAWDGHNSMWGTLTETDDDVRDTVASLYRAVWTKHQKGLSPMCRALLCLETARLTASSEDGEGEGEGEGESWVDRALSSVGVSIALEGVSVQAGAGKTRTMLVPVAKRPASLAEPLLAPPPALPLPSIQSLMGARGLGPCIMPRPADVAGGVVPLLLIAMCQKVSSEGMDSLVASQVSAYLQPLMMLDHVPTPARVCACLVLAQLNASADPSPASVQHSAEMYRDVLHLCDKKAEAETETETEAAGPGVLGDAMLCGFFASPLVGFPRQLVAVCGGRMLGSLGSYGPAAEMLLTVPALPSAVEMLLLGDQAAEAQALAQSAIDTGAVGVADRVLLLCILGEVTQTEALLTQAWTESGASCARAMRTLARMAGARGDHAAVVEHLTQAVQAEPSHTDSWFSLGQARLDGRVGSPAEAAKAFEQCAALTPQREASTAHGNAALAWLAAGQPNRALGCLLDAVRTPLPVDPKVLALLLLTAMQCDRPEVGALAVTLVSRHPHMQGGDGLGAWGRGLAAKGMTWLRGLATDPDAPSPHMSPITSALEAYDSRADSGKGAYDK